MEDDPHRLHHGLGDIDSLGADDRRLEVDNGGESEPDQRQREAKHEPHVRVERADVHRQVVTVWPPDDHRGRLLPERVRIVDDLCPLFRHCELADGEVDHLQQEHGADYRRVRFQ